MKSWGVMPFVMNDALILSESHSQGYAHTHSCHVCFSFAKNETMVTFQVLLGNFLCMLINILPNSSMISWEKSLSIPLSNPLYNAPGSGLGLWYCPRSIFLPFYIYHKLCHSDYQECDSWFCPGSVLFLFTSWPWCVNFLKWMLGVLSWPRFWFLDVCFGLVMSVHFHTSPSAALHISVQCGANILTSLFD